MKLLPSIVGDRLSGSVPEDLDFGGGVNPAEKDIHFRHHRVFDEVFATVTALPDRKVLDNDNRVSPHLEGKVGNDILRLGPALVALQGVHGVRFCNHTFSPTREHKGT